MKWGKRGGGGGQCRHSRPSWWCLQDQGQGWQLPSSAVRGKGGKGSYQQCSVAGSSNHSGYFKHEGIDQREAGACVGKLDKPPEGWFHLHRHCGGGMLGDISSVNTFHQLQSRQRAPPCHSPPQLSLDTHDFSNGTPSHCIRKSQGSLLCMGLVTAGSGKWLWPHRLSLILQLGSQL